MITLKHLAREYDIADLFKLRMFLREHFGKRHRWRWDPDSDHQDLQSIRAKIEEHYGKKP